MNHFILFLFFFIFLCATKKEIQPPPPILALSSDQLIIEKDVIQDTVEVKIDSSEEQLINTNHLNLSVEDSIEVEQDLDTIYQSGYRVQILASTSRNTAYSLKESIENNEKIDEPIYVEEESPLYKVRVGDIKNQKKATYLRQKLAKLGYRDAFIVQTKIKIIKKR